MVWVLLLTFEALCTGKHAGVQGHWAASNAVVHECMHENSIVISVTRRLLINL